VNERFARAAAAVARRGDLVWVHDYHLQLVPRMLRSLRSDVRIGFFLHIPFPPEELFAWLPWRREVLAGLLGSDVIGFQTHAAAQNFARAAREFAGAEGSGAELGFDGRAVRVGSFPISIDFNWFDRSASAAAVVDKAHEIRRRIGASRKILLSIDRLDYTKGIDTRLRAFETLLARGSASVGDCVFIQIAAPSRESVREYAQIRTRVEQIVGRINGEYSVPGRVAVHYFRRGFTREELLAYYRAADVMVVTPLRDGINLVAKEYVATRSDLGGVLVLSEFAGAARELRRALLVNPRDIEGMAMALEQAVRLTRAEARHRMAILRTVVRRHDVFEWASGFLRELAP
jgi:trehalose 6-phosphate synthase